MPFKILLCVIVFVFPSKINFALVCFVTYYCCFWLLLLLFGVLLVAILVGGHV